MIMLKSRQILLWTIVSFWIILIQGTDDAFGYRSSGSITTPNDDVPTLLRGENVPSSSSSSSSSSQRMLWKLPECGFDEYSCRGTMWRSCRALADRIDDEWCYNLVENTNVCCGEYRDCCENDKVLFTIVVGAAVLILGLCILACCWWIPLCPLHTYWEDRQRQLIRAEQVKQAKENRQQKKTRGP